MRKFRDIIESPFPVPTNALWLKGSNLKGFINGKWITIGGGSTTKVPDNLEDILTSLPDSICFPTGTWDGDPSYPAIQFKQWKKNEDGTYSAQGNLLTPISTAREDKCGVVRRATAVDDLAGTEESAAICTKVNAILAALRTAGLMSNS